MRVWSYNFGPYETALNIWDQKVQNSVFCEAFLPMSRERHRHLATSFPGSLFYPSGRIEENPGSPAVGSKNCAFYDKRMKLGTRTAHIV